MVCPIKCDKYTIFTVICVNVAGSIVWPPFDSMQSTYREYHSTETALVKVDTDIMEVVDGVSCVILVLLDLSAALDTLFHEILLHRLEKRLGVNGSALLWFMSYI